VTGPSAVAGAAICAPLRVEQVALRGARAQVVRTGMGRRRSIRSARRLAGRPVLVAGVAGGLAAEVQPGDIVVATEVRGPDGGRVNCPSAALLAAELRRLGLRIHCGPIASSRRLLDGAGRRKLAGAGALAVDMESVWLAPAADAGSPFAVVRAISDTEREPMLRPGIVPNGIAALRSLRQAVPALDAWAAAVGQLTRPEPESDLDPNRDPNPA
jgi:4-hydroxy-3-methylbut-2-enyl diphosphate reductase